MTQSGVRPGAAELVATELGTNLLRHAMPGGYVLARKAGDGIELISVDGGPGMPATAVSRALSGQERVVPAAVSVPGVPPAPPPPYRGGGLNAGLGVVRRQAAEFDLYSNRRGTVVYARLGSPPPTGSAGRDGGWRFGGVNIPYGGDGESGDAWAVTPGRTLSALVVDGLGHGPAAAVAARAAVAEFERTPMTGLEPFVRHAHEVLRATRGGVLGVCLIDPVRGELGYAAVGNVTGRVVTGGHGTHLLDRPGTLGTHIPLPTIRVQHCPWQPGSTLILVSDGIRSGWTPAPEDHPGLLRHHPAVVAAVLHREYGRPNDDATVLVVQQS
ncbi:SpoIIE family protein phosphatase [Streptomyces sp. YIM S03343]